MNWVLANHCLVFVVHFVSEEPLSLYSTYFYQLFALPVTQLTAPKHCIPNTPKYVSLAVVLCGYFEGCLMLVICD